MPEVILQANTLAELKAKLAELDIEVPARSEGRKPCHAERYGIAHLLATLPAERLSFPLTLSHRDKPDFLLAMRDGGEVGIEHTEAVPENVARAQFLRGKGLGPDVYFIPHVAPGEPRKTVAELRSEIELDAPGGAWVGDSPEREWAEAIAHYVKVKLPKATANGFARYLANWLIVYDNWPLPAVNYAKAATYLAPLLMEMGAFLVFDAIFVHDDSHMCEFLDTPVNPVLRPLQAPK
jgi:hypothetical protein